MGKICCSLLGHLMNPEKWFFFTSCKRTLEKTKLNFELNGTNPRSVVQMVCELQLFKGKPPFATNSVLACIKSNMKRNFFLILWTDFYFYNKSFQVGILREKAHGHSKKPIKTPTGLCGAEEPSLGNLGALGEIFFGILHFWNISLLT